MKAGKLTLISICILFLLTALAPSRASMQSGNTLSGQIKTKSVKGSIQRFSLKLYPPKTSKKPIILTDTDSLGNFKFTGLSEKSYMLEVYSGKQMVYQGVIELNGSLCCVIDLTGSYSKKVCPCTSTTRKS
ncbi:MAG: hypothetical protein H7Y30_15635 [Pyrinomonadaceae bacterium]|nr:hypothetical protein [Pyrinomonadaceae bacterium]